MQSHQSKPAMGDSNQAESLAQAIKFTQKLRASVGHVFHTLAEGQGVGNGNEKQILNQFQETLLAVNNDFGDLEKTSAMLQSPPSTQPNSIYLSIDPAIDKLPIYSQILEAYKWSNKVSEMAGFAANILDQHVKLKRVQHIGNIQNKRIRRLSPTGHAIPPSAVEAFFARINQKSPDMNIEITRPMGSHAIIQISLRRILKAQVALRGFIIEWVNVRGFNEENPDESKLDLWAKSKYQVFQKVTESATAATLHFYSPVNSDLSLNSFLHWFQGYKTLFSAPCKKCNRHNLNGLPPTWRDLRTIEPYHDVCRQ